MQNSYNKNIVINAALSAFQIVCVSIILFAFYRYCNRILGSENFGIWALVSSVSSIVNFANLGITNGLVKFTPTYIAKNEIEKLNGAINFTTILVLFTYAILALILYFVAPIYLKASLSSTHLNTALKMLPLSLFTLSANAQANVKAAVIEGLNQGRWKSISLIFSQIFFLILIYTIVPSKGLIGIILAQMGQVLIYWLSLEILLKAKFKEYKPLKLKIHPEVKKDLLNYGFKLQGIAIAAMTYDPITKYFLSKYTGLESVAIFEIANKLSLQIRNMFSTVFNNLIPKVALIYTTNKESILKPFYNIQIIINYFSIAIVSILLFCTPICSIVFLGKVNPMFLNMYVSLTLALLFSLMLAPSFTFASADGRVSFILIGQILIAVLNYIFSWLLSNFLPHYTYLGWSLSLIIGSAFIFISYQKANNFKHAEFYSKKFILIAFLLGLQYVLFDYYTRKFTIYVWQISLLALSLNAIAWLFLFKYLKEFKISVKYLVDSLGNPKITKLFKNY